MGNIITGSACYDNTTTTDNNGTYTWYPYYPIYEPCYPYYYYKHYITCPKCQGSIECGDNYCRYCGHQLNPPHCPHCGKKL